MKPEELVPIIAAIGFGIQQLLQIVDPIVCMLIIACKGRFGEARSDNTKSLPFGITDVDAKKAILGLLSFVIGFMIASTGKIQVLKTSGLDLPRWDVFITALTISAGTEGLNSVVKLVQYVKDAVKAKTPPSVAQNSPAPQSPRTSNSNPT